MPKLTSTRQRNAVSEGAAFGLLLNGYRSISAERWRVDLAFTGSLRGWSYSSRFPQVSSDLAKGLNGTIALTRAGATKRTSALYWEHEGGQLTIYPRLSDWDPEDPTDRDFTVSVIGGDVPVDGWADLGADLVARLRR